MQAQEVLPEPPELSPGEDAIYLNDAPVSQPISMPSCCGGYGYGYGYGHNYPIGNPYCISAACPDPERHYNGYGYGIHHIGRPFGSYMRAYMGTQIANGVAGRLVLYDYDFFPAGCERETELTSRGRYQLFKLSRMLMHHPYPLIVERSRDNVALDEGRRASVAVALSEFHVPGGPDRVIVARPNATGLDGLDAELIYQNRLFQTETRGAFPLQGVDIR